MERALDGVVVADFTQMMQGPWATQKLGDMGADIVKIERIGGEWERTLDAAGQLLDDVSPFFLAMNRNKRSITVDLKSEEGSKVALEITREADVLVENFRPGVMDRFGLGYDDVTAVNPEIVYVSATGFGRKGPYVDRPGQDLLLQSMSGLAKNTGRKGDPPTPVGTAIVDEHAAMLIAFHTMVALFHEERTGQGQRVDVNLLDAALDFQCQELTAALNMDIEVERSEEGIAQSLLGAPYGIYETADGYVAIAMAPMATIAETVDLPELADYETPEKTFEARDEIKRTLETFTRTRESDELLETLLEADVWAAEVNDYRALEDDPQVEHNEMLVELEHPEDGSFTTTGIPVKMSETPGDVQLHPPRPGEHTDEVLAELGYGEAERTRLRDDGVVGGL